MVDGYIEKTKTSALELKKIHNKLVTASMKSKIEVSIDFRINHKELNKPSFFIHFFTKNENFFIDFYTFDHIYINNEKLELALNLIKNSSKFQEIREQYYKLKKME
ncbi:hypothetical protein [Arcobacter aquimarinus]|uniref:hypothetical protein n=1 Tax=Arcobacter aquimarinus TaxID=1315211 RepID=UPI003BAFDB1D